MGKFADYLKKNIRGWFILTVIASAFLFLICFAFAIDTTSRSPLGKIADLMIALSTLAVTTAALYGLDAWKKQLKGKTEYGVARDLLKATYRIRDAIELSRSLWIAGSEFPKEKENFTGENPGEEILEGLIHVYDRR